MDTKYGSKQILDKDGKIEFRSKLEGAAAKLLKEAGIEFEYEPFSILLLDKVELPSFERWGKIFKQVKYSLPITYTPDFIGNWWIMETKGKRTPDFNLKWKMFKKYLIDNKMDDFVLFMPSNQREIKTCIEIIKEQGQQKERDFFKKYKFKTHHLTKDEWDKLYDMNNKKKKEKKH